MDKTIKEAIKDGWNICDKDVSMSSFDFYDTGFLNGVAYLRSLPLAQRLTSEEKERVRKEYANTYPNDIDCGVENMLIQGVLERIFGADFFKEGGMIW